MKALPSTSSNYLIIDEGERNVLAMKLNLKEFRNEVQKTAKRSMGECYIGGDTFNFEMAVEGANEGIALDLTPLKSSNGKEFGAVEINKGKISIKVSLPKFIRPDNIMPFSMSDAIMLEVMKNDIEPALKLALKGKIDDRLDVLSATAKSIECNITKRVAGDSTCSHVLNLINRSFHEGTNIVYQRASTKCKYDKENETVIVRKRNYYVLKSYDKSLQQRKAGNQHIENGLLRIEVIMLNRTIDKLFGTSPTIENVLTEQGLMRIIKEYKRIFIEDVINGHIRPCLRYVTDTLFKTLTEKDNQLKAIALHKEIIMDVAILHKALVKWYKAKGYSKERAKRNADTYICRCRIKYGFPTNVIDTMREFKKLCN